MEFQLLEMNEAVKFAQFGIEKSDDSHEMIALFNVVNNYLIVRFFHIWK